MIYSVHSAPGVPGVEKMERYIAVRKLRRQSRYQLTLEELLANLGDGLYLTEVSGLHAGANPISGDFSLLSRGFEVKGGRVVRAVEEFTVAGNFYQLLKDITDVGGDLLFEASPIGSPSVLVKRLDVAGA